MIGLLRQLLAAILCYSIAVPAFSSANGNGNTTASGGNTGANGYVYDFENHLIQQGGISMVYDGDGNRVAKTVAGVTTSYFIDTNNPTGYAQVVTESVSDGRSVAYVYGLERISQSNRTPRGIVTPSFYVYDGHGSVRALTDTTGAVTDTYDYDAFGNLLHSTTTLPSPTPNNYLYSGEPFDPDLNLYYNRARYLNTSTGRFWSMDSHEGNDRSPLSLHKYVYGGADPIDRTDASGNDFDIGSLSVAEAIGSTIAAVSVIALGAWIRGDLRQGDAEQPPSPNATSTNSNSIEIFGSHLSPDALFAGFMSSYQGVSSGNVATVQGGPVSGIGQKLTFQLRATSFLGLLRSIGQSPFSVKTTRYDSQEHAIAVVTLQGHPLRGYRYWKVFSPDGRPGHFVIETGALDEPGPGPLDGLKFIVGRSQQLRIWEEYLEKAVSFSQGREGFDPAYDFPSGLYGGVGPAQVLGELGGRPR